MSFKLNDILIAINIISYSGKLNPLDMQELGRLYRVFVGFQLYSKIDAQKKNENINDDSENKSEGIENKSEGIENKSEGIENKSEGIENKSEEIENKSELNISQPEYNIKLVKSLELKDIVDIHNLIYKYSQIENIFKDKNKEGINLLITNIRNFIKEISNQEKKQNKHNLETIIE